MAVDNSAIVVAHQPTNISASAQYAAGGETVGNGSMGCVFIVVAYQSSDIIDAADAAGSIGICHDAFAKSNQASRIATSIDCPNRITVGNSPGVRVPAHQPAREIARTRHCTFGETFAYQPAVVRTYKTTNVHCAADRTSSETTCNGPIPVVTHQASGNIA